MPEVLHKILPSQVDPLVSLMKVEKVPDSTYDMVGGLAEQVKQVKEVRAPFPKHLTTCTQLQTRGTISTLAQHHAMEVPSTA